MNKKFCDACGKELKTTFNPMLGAYAIKVDSIKYELCYQDYRRVVELKHDYTYKVRNIMKARYDG